MFHLLNNQLNEQNVISNYYKAEHSVIVTTKNGVNERRILITLDTSTYNLKITLSDETDIMFLYTVNITHDDYLLLKSEQGLLVNFSDFSEQIVNLLKQCSSVKMFLQLTPVKLNLYNLEFIERNDFKNLVHLQLKLFACENTEILSNITAKIGKYKDLLHKLEQKNELLNNEISTLMKDNEALCKNITETENKVRKECSERLNRNEIDAKRKYNELELQFEKLREDNSSLNRQIRELNATNKNMKSQQAQYVSTIESMNNEIGKLEQEIKNLKHRTVQYDSEQRAKETEINSLNTKLAVLEQSSKEKQNVIEMLKDTLARSEKEVEALRASSNLKSEHEMKLKLTIKQQADDLAKANQIIVQNNSNYDQLKKKNTIVSKILIDLERDHTTLQKDYDTKLNLIEQLKRTVDAHSLELNKCRTDNERLVKALRLRDENIAELKRIIDERENQPPIVPIEQPWQPLPSPSVRTIKASNSEINGNCTGNVLTNSNKINKPLMISKNSDTKFPSAYFTHASSAGLSKNKKS